MRKKEQRKNGKGKSGEGKIKCLNQLILCSDSEWKIWIGQNPTQVVSLPVREISILK
jgi:hypothetical protein